MGTNVKINFDATSNPPQFAQLLLGDWFYSEGDVYIKVRGYDGKHYGVDIEDGLTQSFEPNEEVVFLNDVEINI